MEWAAGPYKKNISKYLQNVFLATSYRDIKTISFIGEFTTITFYINLMTLIRQSSFICLNYQSLNTSL